MIRALLMHHPFDKQVWHIDDEYYFGDDFLVCPVMNSDGYRDIYLPEGYCWVDFFTGERFRSNQWMHHVFYPLDRMPVFVREGARILLYPDDVECTDDMEMDKTVTIEINKDFKGIL